MQDSLIRIHVGHTTYEDLREGIRDRSGPIHGFTSEGGLMILGLEPDPCVHDTVGETLQYQPITRVTSKDGNCDLSLDGVGGRALSPDGSYWVKVGSDWYRYRAGTMQKRQPVELGGMQYVNPCYDRSGADEFGLESPDPSQTWCYSGCTEDYHFAYTKGVDPSVATYTAWTKSPIVHRLDDFGVGHVSELSGYCSKTEVWVVARFDGCWGRISHNGKLEWVDGKYLLMDLKTDDRGSFWAWEIDNRCLLYGDIDGLINGDLSEGHMRISEQAIQQAIGCREPIQGMKGCVSETSEAAYIVSTRSGTAIVLVDSRGGIEPIIPHDRSRRREISFSRLGDRIAWSDDSGVYIADLD